LLGGRRFSSDGRERVAEEVGRAWGEEEERRWRARRTW